MSRLFMFILAVTVFSLTATGIIVVLVAGLYDWKAIVAAGAIGAAGGVPISWAITRWILSTDPRKR